MAYSRLMVELESKKQMPNDAMTKVVEGVNNALDSYNAGKRVEKKVSISKMNIVVNCERSEGEGKGGD